MASTMPGTASEALAMLFSHCRAGSRLRSSSPAMVTPNTTSGAAAPPQYSSVLRSSPLLSVNTVASWASV